MKINIFMKCPDDAVVFIKKIFHQCVGTKREIWSFCIGTLSSIIWLISSMPQIIHNYKYKRVEISFYFFLLICIGDISNLIGVFVSRALATQIINSLLFLFLDMIMLVQYLYYKYCFRGFGESSSFSTSGNDNFCDSNPIIEFSQNDDKEEPMTNPYSRSSYYKTTDEFSYKNKSDIFISPVIPFTMLIKNTLAIEETSLFSKEEKIGFIFGWISFIIYFCSRIPQIFKSFKEKSSGDLSIFYVVLSIMGNSSYFISIFLKSTEKNYLKKQLPFILGAIFPAVLDIILFILFFLFRKKESEESF